MAYNFVAMHNYVTLWYQKDDFVIYVYIDQNTYFTQLLISVTTYVYAARLCEFHTNM